MTLISRYGMIISFLLSLFSLDSRAQIASTNILLLPSPVIDSVGYHCTSGDPVQVYVSNQISPCVYSVQSTVPQVTPVPENATGAFYNMAGLTDAVFRVHNGACYTDIAVHFDCNGSPLPVRLSDFSVRLYQDHQALLNWTVQEEGDIDHYEVEESVDGRNFRYLATIAITAGSSSLKNYQYTDTHLAQGYNFYRLKIVGTDGTIQYSEVRFVVYTNDRSVVWYPNPASTYLYLELYNDMGAPVVLQTQIYNSISGNQQHTQQYNLEPGLNKLAIDVRLLPDGTYYLLYGYKGAGAKIGTIRFQKLSP